MTYSSRDPNQITQAEHDEKLNARKVVVVGGDLNLANAIKDGLKELRLETKFPDFVPVEKEVIVKEYEVIQVPQIIKEPELKIIETEKIVLEPKIIEIDKPLIIKETEIKVIEKEVIVKEVKDLDKLIKLLMLSQMVTLIIIVLKTLL